MERKLNRRVEFDERSRAYPIRTLLPEKRPRSYTWGIQASLDQGREGACVGFAWAHELAAVPKVIRDITEQSARDIYTKAKTLDPWPGEAYEGTSVLAGVKAVQELYPRKISEYRWCFGLDDLVQTLGYFGPVVLGINWLKGMDRPDENGLVTAEGPVRGGHAILARGVNIRRGLIRLHNSWGPAWGKEGDCFVSFNDMDKLLHMDGEACVPVVRGF